MNALSLLLSDPFFETALRREPVPKTDVYEDDEGFHLSSELPGIPKESITVSIENGLLSISGERKEHKKNKIREESYYGSLTRQFSLPPNIDVDNVSSELKDGVLSIKIPKKDKRKSIEIKTTAT